ncbi:hypothetical protein HCN44_008206 [Aphidius gifuensis]|uniref:Uncharacterized protein n=1 Tax=Aphidius gifuensis TaxID=684658 RepID=A0A834XMD2_APHGI|nr:hypothetical protein HCN44_008206 [Aphidius gifuensis]
MTKLMKPTTIKTKANGQNTTSWGDNGDTGVVGLIKARRNSIFKIDRLWSDAGDFVDTVFYNLGLTGENLDECTTKVLEILIPSHEIAPVEIQNCYNTYLNYTFMNTNISTNQTLVDAHIKLRRCIIIVTENFERAVMKAINRISDCEL